MLWADRPLEPLLEWPQGKPLHNPSADSASSILLPASTDFLHTLLHGHTSLFILQPPARSASSSCPILLLGVTEISRREAVLLIRPSSSSSSTPPHLTKEKYMYLLKESEKNNPAISSYNTCKQHRRRKK